MVKSLGVYDLKKVKRVLKFVCQIIDDTKIGADKLDIMTGERGHTGRIFSIEATQ